MAEFTKEQLAKRCKSQIEAMQWLLDRCPGDVNANESLRVAEIALAALTAEPLAWTDEEELRDIDRGGCGYMFTCKPVTPHADERRIIKLYRLPLLEGLK